MPISKRNVDMSIDQSEKFFWNVALHQDFNVPKYNMILVLLETLKVFRDIELVVDGCNCVGWERQIGFYMNLFLFIVRYLAEMNMNTIIDK